MTEPEITTEPLDPTEIEGFSPDFRSELADQLAKLAPEAVADGKIDVEKLVELLEGDATDTSERFGLFWPGKKRAMRAAQTPTSATLAPDYTNSKNWDETQNVFIEGDNLEVLKIFQKHYHGKIKMIYIDPPYNTGKDFVYPDNYKEGVDNYLQWSKQVNDNGQKLSTNTDAGGRIHTNWLNMMYPRLKLARNLLARDGAVFMSIDDAEFENLKRTANEVFGENNFVGTMIWSAGRKNDSKYISASHEYILCFAKDLDYLRHNHITWKVRKPGLDAVYSARERFLREANGDWEEATRLLKQWFKSLPAGDPAKQSKHYANIDEHGVFFADNISWPGGGGPKYDVLHPTTGLPVKIPSRGWLFQESVMQDRIAEGRVHFGADETKVPTYKRYLHETEFEAPYSVFYQDGRSASKRLRALFDGTAVFDFPKDETVIKSLLQMVTGSDDLVLDFFSGSSTTAHAVMQLNAEDGGNRRHIQVQLPEPTPEGSEARKAGFDTIADIARERIRRAGEKIEADFADQLAEREHPLDTGFRAYKLTDTNFSKWNIEAGAPLGEVEKHLFDIRDTANDDATTDAILTELLLKQGMSLTEHITDETIAGLDCKAIRATDGSIVLLAYLDEHTPPTIDQLRDLVAAEPARIVILEDCFNGNDELKTNLKQMCATHDIELKTA